MISDQHPRAPEAWRGVLWDDCVISWRDGGRSTAADEGIDCEPAEG